MNFLDKLEKRYPQLAMEGLIRYIALMMLTTFFLNHTGMLSYGYLNLNRHAIMSGEIWRLFTFLVIPFSRNVLFLIFELSILVMCADGLESEWGTFKLSVYYYCGAFANIVIAFLIDGVAAGSYFLYLSLFLGFATVHPNHQILLFLIIPVRVKYLAMFSGAIIFYQVALGPWPIKVAALLSVANYFLFFWQKAILTIKHNRNQYMRAAEFQRKMEPKSSYRHKCVVCGKTEIDDTEEEFRYCTCKECGSDAKAFCQKHLAEHKSNQN